MELRVPHVTSYARAPSSLLFLRSACYPQMPRFLQYLREVWPMPLPLVNHSALALFAQRTRVPTSARSTGFCVIWVCISSSSSSSSLLISHTGAWLLITSLRKVENIRNYVASCSQWKCRRSREAPYSIEKSPSRKVYLQ